MADETRGRSGARLWLAVLVGACYLLTASGHTQVIDVEEQLSAAASMRAGRAPVIYVPVVKGQDFSATAGRNGRGFAAHDLGYSLLLLPLTLIPGTVRTVHDGEVCWPRDSRGCMHVVDAAYPTARLEAVASILPPILGTLLVLVFVDLLLTLGFDERTACITGLLLAFASIVWVYSHISFDATATGLFLLSAASALARYERSTERRWLVAGGAALAAAIIVRSDTLVLVPTMSILVAVHVWNERKRVGSALRTAAAWGLPILVGPAVNAGYNWFRFGGPSNNGNLSSPLLAPVTPVLTGLVGQILSPGKGMLFTTPLLLLALMGWPRFIRSHRLLAYTVGATSVVCLVTHAVLFDWSGDVAWGSRHTVQITAFCLLPLAYVVRDVLRRRADRVVEVALIVLAVAGLLIQLTGVLIDYESINEGLTTSVMNDMGSSQSWLGAQALGRALTGGQVYPRVGTALAGRTVTAPVDLWWARPQGGSPGAYLSLLVAVALASLGVFAALRLRAALRTPARTAARHADGYERQDRPAPV